MSKHSAVGRKNSFQNKIQAQGGTACEREREKRNKDTQQNKVIVKLKFMNFNK